MFVLKTEFWICHILKLYNSKATATLIIMHDTKFSVHTRMCGNVYDLFGTENGLYGIWISDHTHLFYNFMNIPHWIPWKPVKFPFPFPSPWRAPYGVTLSLTDVDWKLQKRNTYIHTKYTTFAHEMIGITKRRGTFNTYSRNLTSTTEWKVQYRYQTHANGVVFLSCMKHFGTCI